ncbi:MAG: hypothetical protein IAF38_07885, partial [Bacteroidia bacterium]|nr:hypothetical protein [Bacteroidia bacterium]
MAESITISGNPPELKSMQFGFLRDQGISRIQQLGGRIWTNFNLDDPGVTILEALCYAITDLGYRTSYSIPDILAPDPTLPPTDIKNFYTARQILPVCPVTFPDYRKLLIDVEVHDPEDKDCPFAGVKNAWIEIAPDNEIPVYLDEVNDKLVYTPVDPSDPKKIDIKVLYDVLLEFSTCDVLGDLNENTIEDTIKLYNAYPTTTSFDSKFSGIEVTVQAEFPRWDAPGIDWDDFDSVKGGLKNIVIDFARMPSNYKLDEYGLLPDKTVYLSISKTGFPPVNTTSIERQIDRLLTNPDGDNPLKNLVVLYQRKVKKVLQILCEVRKTIMANRNLCEDFFRIKALKVEEIALCADMIVETDADIERIEAQVYFEIANFLAPTVLFHTLDEMYAKGLRTEEIFEGPPLDHGFIDDSELAKADRKKSIHVSDLINIIMDIPGVIAVKNIQIANIPLDNIDNIPSKSVKWCLQLAFDKNYVPRLSIDRSTITFLKDLIPFKANEPRMRAILEDITKEQRKQKLHDITLDLPVPQGTFRSIEDYRSVQEEFPLVYGIGSPGLPANATEMRRAQARQLKGFMMFFDQLLVDFLAQLANVKDLFSMNGEKDADGNFVIDKTYFTESLLPFVPAVTDLLVNISTYPDELQRITESEELFDKRRNRFLNHLMARFGEQFTDYALLVYNISGPKAPEELLVDKLRLLENYPEISGCRFRAFNYESPCNIWHIDNASGLEKRISLLTGIDERTGNDLEFPFPYNVIGTEPNLSYSLQYGGPTELLYSVDTFESVSLLKLGIELLIINGIYDDKYVIMDFDGKIIPDNLTPFRPPLRVSIICGACEEHNELATDNGGYKTFLQADTALSILRPQALALFTDEYYNNPQSNRNNLECPEKNYFDTEPPIIDALSDPPSYTIKYNLYRDPFVFGPPNVVLLEGPFVGYGDCKLTEAIINVIPADFKIVLAGNFEKKIIAGDPVSIKDSVNNNGDYTVFKSTLVHLGPGQYETEIVFSGSPVLTTNSPFGYLSYNTMTLPQFTAFADAQVEKALFEIASRGLNSDNYIFTDISYPLTPYKFQIADHCGDAIGTSVEADFNEALAVAIANHQGSALPQQIEVIDSSLNNNFYDVFSTEAIGDQIVIKLSLLTPIPSLVVDGKVRFGEADFNVLSVSTSAHTLTVSSNITRKLFPGMAFTIYGPNILFPIVYIVKDTLLVGTDTVITIDGKVKAENYTSAQLSYVQELEIISVEQNGLLHDSITVKGGADDVAIKQMTEFLRLKFFSHEGLHIVEHVLLRPKYNNNEYIKYGEGAKFLDTSANPLGTIVFMKVAPLFSIDLANNTFFITGDFTTELTALTEIIITDSEDGLIDGKYNILTVGFTGTETGVKVLQVIPTDAMTVLGNFNYLHEAPIASYAFGGTNLLIHLPPQVVSVKFPATIKGSENGVNDGNFLIDSVVGPKFAHIEFSARETLIQDRLLEVNLETDCGTCKIDDPYSFLFSVILPAWQGRFANQEFRRFFDRSLRLETPAHLVP